MRQALAVKSQTLSRLCCMMSFLLVETGGRGGIGRRHARRVGVKIILKGRRGEKVKRGRGEKGFAPLLFASSLFNLFALVFPLRSAAGGRYNPRAAVARSNTLDAFGLKVP
jgi:hypothetical protein